MAIYKRGMSALMCVFTMSSTNSTVTRDSAVDSSAVNSTSHSDKLMGFLFGLDIARQFTKQPGDKWEALLPAEYGSVFKVIVSNANNSKRFDVYITTDGHEEVHENVTYPRVIDLAHRFADEHRWLGSWNVHGIE